MVGPEAEAAVLVRDGFNLHCDYFGCSESWPFLSWSLGSLTVAVNGCGPEVVSEWPVVDLLDATYAYGSGMAGSSGARVVDWVEALSTAMRYIDPEVHVDYHLVSVLPSDVHHCSSWAMMNGTKWLVSKDTWWRSSAWRSYWGTLWCNSTNVVYDTSEVVDSAMMLLDKIVAWAWESVLGSYTCAALNGVDVSLLGLLSVLVLGLRTSHAG